MARGPGDVAAVLVARAGSWVQVPNAWAPACKARTCWTPWCPQAGRCPLWPWTGAEGDSLTLVMVRPCLSIISEVGKQAQRGNANCLRLHSRPEAQPAAFSLSLESGTPPEGLDPTHLTPTEMLCVPSSGGETGRRAIPRLQIRGLSCDQSVEERAKATFLQGEVP